MIYGEHLLALAARAVDGKCAKTRIIVDWGAGYPDGYSHCSVGQNGFLHQKFNIFLTTKARAIIVCANNLVCYHHR